ncbi:sulfur carrier protein ThiS [Campylobacter pinnipediorum]|uniref:sulfur carrier protein ThiS n=1 Tax=Campylobacter pinnipediorum TaxID=1965231 RepID=UPI00084D1CCF|nr:sulfur carrier protein ThiS [Campylobacter pinnipediorum]OPA78309.1 thiamine biosynthesis protein ThiS [Campylobacter pinnipediorum subsp. pinnipediorum]
MLVINGKIEDDFLNKSVDEYLLNRQINKDRVVVELNGEILPKDKFDTKFNENDKVEVVCFVGGG